MPLLFWYLPFMIVSGTFDALYEQDDTRSLAAEKVQDLGNAGRSLVAPSD
jgi:hypothetical protein